jgi:hypothetical protein
MLASQLANRSQSDPIPLRVQSDDGFHLASICGVTAADFLKNLRRLLDQPSVS